MILLSITGHHVKRQGVHWTVAPVAQREILDRLLELNHQRYAGEEATGANPKRGSRRGRQTARAMESTPQAELFAEDMV